MFLCIIFMFTDSWLGSQTGPATVLQTTEGDRQQRDLRLLPLPSSLPGTHLRKVIVAQLSKISNVYLSD